jgi:hypothetical protein
MNSLSLLAGNCLWRRWLQGTAIAPSKEILLNLHRDLITSRPDPPYPGDVEPVPQALESGLQRLEIDRIVC